MKKFLKENAWGTSTKELTKMFNEKFKTDRKERHIKSYRVSNNMPSGIDARFKKGNKPKHTFKKGAISVTALPVGTERVRSGNKLSVKVAEPDHWLLVQHIIRSREHGKIPDDHLIMFLDGNVRNLDIDNLYAISKKAMPVMAKNRRFTENQDINIL